MKNDEYQWECGCYTSYRGEIVKVKKHDIDVKRCSSCENDRPSSIYNRFLEKTRKDKSQIFDSFEHLVRCVETVMPDEYPSGYAFRHAKSMIEKGEAIIKTTEKQ